jgi:hypothetical protein
MKLYYSVEPFSAKHFVFHLAPKIGPDIIAVNDKHAQLALEHHGIGNYILIYSSELAIKDKTNPVIWDSLLMFSEIQLN